MPQRGYPILMGGFFLAFLGYLLFLQTRSDIGNNGTLRAVSDLFVLFGSVICTFACWYTAFTLRRAQGAAGILASRAWLAWACLGAAALTYSAGQGIWTWYDAHYMSIDLPFPAIYDPFYLAVYPLSWVGIALLIPRSGSAAGRTRLLLDAGAAVASVLAVMWYFILGPTLSSLSGTPLVKTVALAYPLGDLSLCVAAALLLFGPSGARALNGTIGRLAIGVTWLAITDSLYGYEQVSYSYHTGLLQDIGWPMSWLFIGWAALIYPTALARLTGQRLPDDQRARPSRLSTTGAALRATTPMVLALLTCALLLLEVSLHQGVPLIQIVLVCAGLFLLPVVRQALTLIDNLILNERLRTALDQSQQAYQRSQQQLVGASARAERYDELRAGIEDLQVVHSQLARGDLNARARVEGPLSPVAQSLNLLIERLNRWAQLARANQVLEAEANQLRQLLDELGEDRRLTWPMTRSGLATGGALLAVSHLQHQLGRRFGRMRETMDHIGRRWTTTMEVIRRARQSVQEAAGSPQQAQAAQEALLEVEQHLQSSQGILHDLWLQANAYSQGGEGQEVLPVQGGRGSLPSGQQQYGSGQWR